MLERVSCCWHFQLPTAAASYRLPAPRRRLAEPALHLAKTAQKADPELQVHLTG